MNLILKVFYWIVQYQPNCLCKFSWRMINMKQKNFLCSSQTQSNYDQRTNSRSVALHYTRKDGKSNDDLSFSNTQVSIKNVSLKNFRFMYEVPIKQLSCINNSTINLCNKMTQKLFTNNVSQLIYEYVIRLYK